MTIRVFNGSNWNQFAKKISVFRDGLGWSNGIKSLKVYRDPGTNPFWDVAYPEIPVSLTTPIVIGQGLPGTTFSLEAGNGLTIETMFAQEDYRKPAQVTYQWQSSPTNSAPWDNRGPLLTTFSPYLITSSDNNLYFRCVITATNAKGSTVVNSFSQQVYDPTYIFFYGNEFGVATNGMIYFDRTNGSFPVSDTISAMGRILSYFHGFFKTYDIWYRSDSSTFRIYHRLYNAGNNRPAIPGLEYEIVFYNNSNIVDLHIINPGNINAIYSYDNLYPAFVKDFFTRYKSYNISNYLAGTRFRITLDGNTSISASSVAPSTAISVIQASLTNNVVTLTTAVPHGLFGGSTINVTGLPSVFNGVYSISGVPTSTTLTYSKTNANISNQSVSGYIAKPPSGLTDGWIYISSMNDLGVNPPSTLTFSAGSGFSSPVFDINFPYTKSNMFYPNFIGSISASYSGTNSAIVSWQNSSSQNPAYNGNSYRVEVKRSDNNSTVFGPSIVTSTSTTVTGLTLGIGYNITITPNSRSDGLGQFGFAGGFSYSHAGPPGVPTNVNGTAGNGQVALTWSAPASNGGAAITNYLVRYSSNNGSSWSTSINTGGTATSYTVTGLSNGTSYIFQVAAVNSRGQSDWSTSSPSLTPQVVPTNILATTSSSTVLTFNTATITAQLRDSSNNNVSRSGITINFSLSGPAGSTISATSAVTNSSGQASVTFTAGANSGAATITASSSGLTSGVASLTVNLRSALTPSLTWSAQNYGVSVSHNNYDFNYTYSGSIGFPGSLRTGSFASTAFTVLIPVQYGAEQPGISGSNTNFTSGGVNYAGSVTCTISNVWVQNPIINITVSNTRSGYSPGSTTLSNVQGNRARNSITYELINTANGNVMYSITTTATTVTHNYPGSDVGKTVRWRCTPNYNDGYSTNTIRFSQTRPLG